MGVLDGIKILELARVPPAEFPGMLLADMGADVLKIETPEPGRQMDEGRRSSRGSRRAPTWSSKASARAS